MKKVLVCGGRDYADKQRVYSTLNTIREQYGDFIVIHGAAKGADTLADEWAEEQKIVCERYPADWNKYGKRAGYIRNSQMLREGQPDLVIAFPGGNGTDMMVKLAIADNVMTIRIPKKE